MRQARSQVGSRLAGAAMPNSSRPAPPPGRRAGGAATRRRNAATSALKLWSRRFLSSAIAVASRPPLLKMGRRRRSFQRRRAGPEPDHGEQLADLLAGGDVRHGERDADARLLEVEQRQTAREQLTE